VSLKGVRLTREVRQYGYVEVDIPDKLLTSDEMLDLMWFAGEQRDAHWSRDTDEVVFFDYFIEK